MKDSDQQWEEEKKRITQIVDECAARIREHVDTVQIFVSLQRDDASNTMTYEKGAGNFCARFGQTVEWVEIQKQYQRNWANRKDAEDES